MSAREDSGLRAARRTEVRRYLAAAAFELNARQEAALARAARMAGAPPPAPLPGGSRAHGGRR